MESGASRGVSHPCLPCGCACAAMPRGTTSSGAAAAVDLLAEPLLGSSTGDASCSDPLRPPARAARCRRRGLGGWVVAAGAAQSAPLPLHSTAPRPQPAPPLCVAVFSISGGASCFSLRSSSISSMAACFAPLSVCGSLSGVRQLLLLKARALRGLRRRHLVSPPGGLAGRPRLRGSRAPQTLTEVQAKSSVPLT